MIQNALHAIHYRQTFKIVMRNVGSKSQSAQKSYKIKFLILKNQTYILSSSKFIKHNNLKHFGIIEKVCDGIGYNYEPYFRSCCTISNQCGIGQGDCDFDNQCSGDLVCGHNNCPSHFPQHADCCESVNPGTPMTLL